MYIYIYAIYIYIYIYIFIYIYIIYVYYIYAYYLYRVFECMCKWHELGVRSGITLAMKPQRLFCEKKAVTCVELVGVLVSSNRRGAIPKSRRAQKPLPASSSSGRHIWGFQLHVSYTPATYLRKKNCYHRRARRGLGMAPRLLEISWHTSRRTKSHV